MHRSLGFLSTIRLQLSFFPRSAVASAGLLFSALLLASVSNAWSQDITYNIVDYPAYETDTTTGGGTDTISGTIVTDGNTGPLTAADIVGGSFTFQNPTWGAFTFPVLGNVTITGTLAATLSSLSIPQTLVAGQHNELELYASDDSDPAIPTYSLIQYDRDYPLGLAPHYDLYLGEGGTDPPFPAPNDTGRFSTGLRPSGSLILGASDNWIIATAAPIPEPSTFTLLGMALLGLGLVYLRRIRAKESRLPTPAYSHPAPSAATDTERDRFLLNSPRTM